MWKRYGSCQGGPWDSRQSVPKRRHIKFRRRGITQKEKYNIQNTAKVGNQKTWICINTAVRTSNLAFLRTFCLLWWIFIEISEKISPVSAQCDYHSDSGLFLCTVHDQGQWIVESSKECVWKMRVGSTLFSSCFVVNNRLFFLNCCS